MSEALKKLFSSVLSVLPVVVVVLIVHLTKLSPFTGNELIVFSISSVFVVGGMCLFNIGAESSMQKMGELVGSSITKKRNLIKLGISEYYAHIAANSRRGHWFCSNLTTVKRAMSKERLINSGFYDLATAYQSVHVNY